MPAADSVTTPNAKEPKPGIIQHVLPIRHFDNVYTARPPDSGTGPSYSVKSHSCLRYLRRLHRQLQPPMESLRQWTFGIRP